MLVASVDRSRRPRGLRDPDRSLGCLREGHDSAYLFTCCLKMFLSRGEEEDTVLSDHPQGVVCVKIDFLDGLGWNPPLLASSFPVSRLEPCQPSGGARD